MKRYAIVLILSAILAWLYRLLFCPARIEFCSDTQTHGNWRKVEGKRTDYVLFLPPTSEKIVRARVRKMGDALEHVDVQGHSARWD